MRSLLKYCQAAWLLFALSLLTLGCESSAQQKQLEARQQLLKKGETPPSDVPEAKLSPDHSELKQAPRNQLILRQQGTPIAEAGTIFVLLHGYGARGTDLMRLGATLSAELSVAQLYPQAPLSLGNDRYAWFQRDGRGFSNALKKVRALLQQLRHTYPNKRLIIAGFSQGAMLSAQLLADPESALRGALLFSPALQGEWRVPKSTERFPVFISHGTRDRVLSFEGATALKVKLSDAGYPVEFIEFGGGHSIPPIARKKAAEYLRQRAAAF